MDCKWDWSIGICIFMRSMEEKEICQYFNIRGFPTIYYLSLDRKAVSYEGPRTLAGFKNFTQYHDVSQGHQHCEEGFVNFGIFDIVKEAFTLYWPYIIGFGVILPSIVGYLLAAWLNHRDHKKHQEKIRKLKE